MQQIFHGVFSKYPETHAPFLHAQFAEWQETKPLHNLRILHHVPVVNNTLLKIACLVAAGAEVTVTNPDFMKPSFSTLQALADEKIRFVSDLRRLKQESFDIYLDCGNALHQALGSPRIGAIELTGTGDQLYRQSSLDFPVISIDRSLTKQLETVFGMAASTARALTKLTGHPPAYQHWLVFGFGKIGRGLAYLCMKNGIKISIIEPLATSREQAIQLGINAIDAHDITAVQDALQSADIILTATGGADALQAYHKDWFNGKTLANLGILDEFGPRFNTDEVLFGKQPINFALDDPTPIEFIDPEMYVHNDAATLLLDATPSDGVHSLPANYDQQIIHRWCDFHGGNRDEIDQWFTPSS